MGNTPNNNTQLLSNKQGDLSKLVSSYLQERNNTFSALNNNNKQITKSNLSKVIDSKSILNNAKLLSFKVFSQYNSKALNANDYQTVLASSWFSNENGMLQSQLLETNKLMTQESPIYQKKLTIKTNSFISYHPSESHNSSLLNKKTDPLQQTNTYCLNYTQISKSLNQNIDTHLNKSEYTRDSQNKTFDDMNLQEYLNEETKNIRRSISLNHETNDKEVKDRVQKYKKPNRSLIEKNKKGKKKVLNIQSNSTSIIENKTEKKDNTRYNTINYNSLYENEYFYSNGNDEGNNKNKNTIEQSKAPMKTEYNPNLLKSRYITPKSNPKSTSYQSFRSNIKSNNVVTLSNQKKSTIAIRNTAAKKQLSPVLKKKDSLIRVLKKEKLEMKTVPNEPTNKSHLLFTPKTSRVTSPKTSFTSKPVTSYSSRNISYIANQHHIKQGNPAFNIKIDLRELMKEKEEEADADYKTDNNEDKDDAINGNNASGLLDNEYSNRIEVKSNSELTPTTAMVKKKKGHFSLKPDRNSQDRSSLEGLIITHQKVDINGKIDIETNFKKKETN